MIKLIIILLYISCLVGCESVTINYKSNVNATDSQVNQSTEVSPDVQ